MFNSMKIDANGEWLSYMFTLHFHDKNLATVACSDCLDFKTRQCLGNEFTGPECVACIENHALKNHLFSK